MDAVLTAVLPVFALILVGYGCGRGRIFGPGATDSLNLFVVWLALPAVLFQGMAGIGWETLDHPGFVAAFCAGAGASFALAMWSGGRREESRPLADASVEGLAAGYSNTGFMGIPLCLATFGAPGLPPAIVGTLLTASVLFAGGIVLIEIDLNRDRRIGRTLGRVALSLLRNPLILAPAAGLLYAATGLALPAPVDRFASLLAGAASPCALVTIGLFLAQGRGVEESGRPRVPVDRRTVGRLVALKLLVQPAVTGLVAFGLALPTVWAQVALLLAALPTGTGPFMLAKLYGREPELTARVILVSTVISVVTISGLVAWFGQG